MYNEWFGCGLYVWWYPFVTGHKVCECAAHTQKEEGRKVVQGRELSSLMHDENARTAIDHLGLRMARSGQSTVWRDEQLSVRRCVGLRGTLSW